MPLNSMAANFLLQIADHKPYIINSTQQTTYNTQHNTNIQNKQYTTNSTPETAHHIQYSTNSTPQIKHYNSTPQTAYHMLNSAKSLLKQHTANSLPQQHITNNIDVRQTANTRMNRHSSDGLVKVNHRRYKMPSCNQDTQGLWHQSLNSDRHNIKVVQCCTPCIDLKRSSSMYLPLGHSGWTVGSK